MVVTQDSVLHQSAVGLRSIEAKLPMELDTIVWIASMTKPMTGICILMLQDEGKLSLDDPISKHLPEMRDLKTIDGKPVNVTIRHVLTHTSGMSEPKPEETYTFKSLKEASLAYAKLPVTFEPGSKWQYSQTGINTAARIVEVASGKTFDTFLQERLTGPLGMKDTTFYLTAQQMERLANSYRGPMMARVSLKGFSCWLDIRQPIAIVFRPPMEACSRRRGITRDFVRCY